MAESEPIGCIGQFLKLMGIVSSKHLQDPPRISAETATAGELPNPLPYRLRDDYLSPAEFSFFRVLRVACDSKAYVCPKVNLADIFQVVQRRENQGFHNKIDRKHVDFVLCHPATMKPLCGIELDDSSHSRSDRQERDRLVEQVFQAAGLGLVRVPVKATYNVDSLAALLARHFLRGDAQQAKRSIVAATDEPVCPKCGVPMVERTARRGASAGESFFGCPNYPRCREIATRAV